MARLPDGELMQRAVSGLTSQCVGLLGRVYGARVVVVAGSGDNGGDALYAAARLARRGAKVEAVLLDEARGARRRSGGRCGPPAAGSARRGSGASAMPTWCWTAWSASAGAEVCVPPPRRCSSRSKQPRNALIVAVDLPSGIDADTGEVSGPAVRADVTVTFGTYKPGLLISPGAEHVGDLRFVDIGLAPYLEGAPVVEALEPADIEALLPAASAESNKYRRGVVGVAAGSPRYPGAAVLATGAALRSGVGAVRFIGEREVSDGVLARHPEVHGRRRPRPGLDRRPRHRPGQRRPRRDRPGRRGPGPRRRRRPGRPDLARQAPGPRAPDPAHPARRRSRAPARRPLDRRAHRGPAPGRRPRTRRPLRLHRPAEGLDDAHRRPGPHHRPRQPHRHPGPGHRGLRRRPVRPRRRPARRRSGRPRRRQRRRLPARPGGPRRASAAIPAASSSPAT